MAVDVRQVWTGCPHCLAQPHTGPCLPLTAAAPRQVIQGLSDPVLADYELRAETAMVEALQQVMDTVADRIGHIQTASLDVLLAHLPGKHNQEDHGGRQHNSPAELHSEAAIHATYDYHDKKTGWLYIADQAAAAPQPVVVAAARTVWDGCLFCLSPRHPGPCAKPGHDDAGPPGGGGGGGGDQSTSQRGSPAAMHDEEQLRAAYTFTDPATGYRTEVVGVHKPGDPNPDINEQLGGKPTVPAGRTMVTVRITDSSGNRIGEAVRTVHPPGQARVNHNSLVLDEGHRGQGFATRFNAHAEDTYRTNGIKTVTLHADIDVGGYAWARAGYDFRNNRTRAATVAKAYVDSIKRRDPSAVIGRFRELHLSGTATPLDLAMVGHTPGASTWPGKEIMLDSDWQGVKTL